LRARCNRIEGAEGGLFIIQADELLAELGFLDIRVVELGVVRGDFQCADEEVGAVGEPGVVAPWGV
jgi:hypothetical protein